MKPLRLLFISLVTLGVTSALRADAESDLRAAVAQLSAARNYAWDVRDSFEVDGNASPRIPPVAEGETEIGGFTLLMAGRKAVVLLDRQMAVKLRAGWRHADDLTEADVAELRLPPRARDRGALLHRGLPHDVLNFILPRLTALQERSGAIEGEVDMAGLLPSDLSNLARRGVRPTRQMGRSPASRGLPPASFIARIARGQIEEFSITTRLSANVSIPGSPRGEHTSSETFTFRLRDIGQTRVAIEPEAKALFLEAGQR